MVWYKIYYMQIMLHVERHVFITNSVCDSWILDKHSYMHCPFKTMYLKFGFFNLNNQRACFRLCWTVNLKSEDLKHESSIQKGCC